LWRGGELRLLPDKKRDARREKRTNDFIVVKEKKVRGR